MPLANKQTPTPCLNMSIPRCCLRPNCAGPQNYNVLACVERVTLWRPGLGPGNKTARKRATPAKVGLAAKTMTCVTLAKAVHAWKQDVVASIGYILSRIPFRIGLSSQCNQQSALPTIMHQLAAKRDGFVQYAAGPSHDSYFAAALHDSHQAVWSTEYTYRIISNSSFYARTQRNASLVMQHLRPQSRLPTQQMHLPRQHAR